MNTRNSRPCWEFTCCLSWDHWIPGTPYEIILLGDPLTQPTQSGHHWCLFGQFFLLHLDIVPLWHNNVSTTKLYHQQKRTNQFISNFQSTTTVEQRIMVILVLVHNEWSSLLSLVEMSGRIQAEQVKEHQVMISACFFKPFSFIFDLVSLTTT